MWATCRSWFARTQKPEFSSSVLNVRSTWVSVRAALDIRPRRMAVRSVRPSCSAQATARANRGDVSGSRFSASAAIAGHELFLRGEQHLYSIAED